MARVPRIPKHFAPWGAGIAAIIGWGIVAIQFFEARNAELRADERLKSTEERADIRARSARVRDEAGRALDEFLIPVQHNLVANRRMFDLLVGGMDLKRLEYYPWVIQDAMRNNQYLQMTWSGMIDDIQRRNETVANLLETKKYHIADNPELMLKFDEFVLHATQWKITWTAAFKTGPQISPGSPSSQLTPDAPMFPDSLKAPMFPVSLDDMLQAEIGRRRVQRDRID
jgi:hypothetical protein